MGGGDGWEGDEERGITKPQNLIHPLAPGGKARWENREGEAARG